MAPRTRSATKPRDDKLEPSWKPRKRRRVGDPATGVDPTFVRLKLGPTKRSTEIQLRESKRRLKKQKASIKDQGKLTVFIGLPLDILSEVTSFLTPVDILQLSRVSTNFRQLFNPHIARHFWVDARRNVAGLPNCPPDLNEAQFASLMFENHCQACGTQRAINTDFALRHRTCNSCHNELTKKGSNIIEQLGGKEPNPVVFKLVPPSCVDHIPELGVGPFGFRIAGWNAMKEYNIRELTSVIEQYRRLNRHKKKQQEFVEEREKLTKMMMETARTMLDWVEDQKTKKEEEERAKSELRLQEAKKRLLELGWTEKDLTDAKLNIKKLMYQPKDLTPRAWKQSLPVLEAAMMQNRRCHRLKELYTLWPSVLEQLVPANERIFIPHYPSLADIPCVKTLLERDKANTALTRQALENIFFNAFLETRDHQQAVKRLFLREILESEEYNPPLPNGRRKRMARLADNRISPDDPRLFYARHLFYCGAEGCDERNVMTLAKFYDHVRLRHNRLGDPEWVVGLVESDTIQQVVKEILKEIDLPEDANVEDVQPFEGRLQCGCDEAGERQRFGFVSLVQHFYDHETSETHLPSKVWELVSVQNYLYTPEARRVVIERMRNWDHRLMMLCASGARKGWCI